MHVSYVHAKLSRAQLDLTGTKKGCDQGQCGACTVLIDRRRAVSCLTLAVTKDGASITTILSANGHAEVACATSDIGTGTIMAQVAADMLGLPIENISVKIGDSSLPASPVEGGSWIATSVANTIAMAAEEVRDELLRLAGRMPGSLVAGLAVADAEPTDGKPGAAQDRERLPAAGMRFGRRRAALGMP